MGWSFPSRARTRTGHFCHLSAQCHDRVGQIVADNPSAKGAVEPRYHRLIKFMRWNVIKLKLGVVYWVGHITPRFFLNFDGYPGRFHSWRRRYSDLTYPQALHSGDARPRRMWVSWVWMPGQDPLAPVWCQSCAACCVAFSTVKRFEKNGNMLQQTHICCSRRNPI